MEALFNLDEPPTEPRKLLKVDVSELYSILNTDDRFALLRRYISAVFLFETCHDYDGFCQLLADVRSNQDAAEDVGLAINDKIYEELEYQGYTFVELYRDSFIMPAVTSIGALGTYLVGGMTTNQQLLISY